MMSETENQATEATKEETTAPEAASNEEKGAEAGSSQETSNETASEAKEEKKEPLFPPIENKEKLSKRSLRAIARHRRRVRILKDPEFAKGYFETKRKNSAARKKAYKTRHAKK